MNAEPTTINFAISGMTCAGCAGRVEKALNAAEGVLSAEVNLALETASVRFAPDVTDANQIALASEAAGYPARFGGEVDTTDEEMHELFLAIALSFPFVLQMVMMVVGHPFHLSPYVELALAFPIQFWIGARFYTGALHALKAKAGNMDQLVALGTTAAFSYSFWLLATQGMAAAGHLYFEASAVVITLVLLGRVLESRAKKSASSALRMLMDLRPETALVMRAGEEVEVAISDVKINEVVIIKPGDRLPVDGEIINGSSELDESLITGESMPVIRNSGDMVIAGSINGTGLLRVRARKIGQDTTLAKIAHLVEQAQVGKAPIQRLVDKVASIFVPVVLGIAVVTLIVWLVIGAGFEQAFTASIAVLVIACPCALGLATPTALVAGTGVAAQNGILIRDVETLERAANIDTVVFDKTGTLTIGRPEVVEIRSFAISEDVLLTAAGAAQSGSEHPLGKAIVAAAQARNLQPNTPNDFRATVGAGIEATVDGKLVRIGRQSFAVHDPDAEILAVAGEMAKGGQTVVWVSLDGKMAGLLGLKDTPRAEAARAVAALKADGVRTILLTGDNPQTAAHIAEIVGIDEVKSEMRPEDKVAVLQELVADGRHVAMVGDGVNDAPALAVADLGIAMGTGADVALETAGFVLMRPDPTLVIGSLQIARATSRKIKQNLFWAFIYNVIGIPIAAFGLLNPAIAGAAMAFSSVCVVGNSLLLKRWKATVRDAG